MNMDKIEHEILIRCLNVIYTQLLTRMPDTALESIERLIYLIRYLDRADSHAMIGDELQTVREVFCLYLSTEDSAGFEIDSYGVDVRSSIQRGRIVYEICHHGIELIHGGCRLRNLALSQKDDRLTYWFTDAEGNVYRGMIYDEKLHPKD